MYTCTYICQFVIIIIIVETTGSWKRIGPFLFRLCLLSNSDENLYTITYRHKRGSFKYVYITSQKLVVA